MSDTVDAGASRLALLNLSAAALQVALAVAIMTVREPATLMAPVRLSIGPVPSPPFAFVDVAAAAAVVSLIAAAARLVALVPAVRPRYERGLRDGRHGIRWLEYSQTAGITLFLVAQVNGIAEAGALILVYAIGAGSVLLLVLHDRSPLSGARGLLAFSAGAAVAIVPWGVVALYQVVGLIVGPSPGLLAQAGTLVFLIIAIAHWASVWLAHQRRGPWANPLTAERAHIGLTIATSAAFLAIVVLAPTAGPQEWML